jgi:hypothetical protein
MSRSHDGDVKRVFPGAQLSKNPGKMRSNVSLNIRYLRHKTKIFFCKNIFTKNRYCGYWFPGYLHEQMEMLQKSKGIQKEG